MNDKLDIRKIKLFYKENAIWKRQEKEERLLPQTVDGNYLKIYIHKKNRELFGSWLKVQE